MTSKVEICRDALQILGDKSIVSLEENSKEARQCKIAYPRAVETVLREYPWSCAIRRVRLAASAEAAAFGTRKRYRRPVDDIQVLPITTSGEADGLPIPYQLEGRFILCDLPAPLKYRYITNNLDPVDMPPDLRRVIATQLAVRLAEVLTGSQSKLQTALALYRSDLRDAKANDMMEDGIPEILPSSWLEARQ
ncbi:hypothetical protein O4H49_04410 [Kiloniella laminariae]|uniref:Uncharacterized protein n=1 Tax=Kiloniella laminariae TaxID=454162 RepID=A0ABT4LFY0_9PROT|nr:hypothetical protein [Kiloniella laminariae]MCZ4280008.1 hypothetical protein [Kiloniella laminariae]